VIVLCYHRVGGGSAAQLDLPSVLFEWQMKYLKRHHRVVRLDDVVQIAQSKASYPDDVVVITFDDGYEDVYRHAFPVLAKYHLPATVYLATSYVETGRAFPSAAQFNGRDGGRPLTWQQAKEMQRSGLVTVGAHTHTHPNLTTLTTAQVNWEIATANQLIAERLGCAPVHFAYPWGRTSDSVKAIVTPVYRTSVLGGTRKNLYGHIDLNALLRVPIQRSDGRLFFRLKLGSYLLGEDAVRARFGSRRASRSVAGAPR
jgi:peptidoglycan/xylan/chitin deacetylase (PgdA/CDA1 family)